MNQDTPIDWEEDSVAAPTEKLTVISEITDEMLKLEDEIAEIEAELKLKKKEHLIIAQGTLPEALLELGLVQIKHESGRVLTVEKFYQAKISDIMQEKAFAWLKETGNDSIIKTNLSAAFGKGEAERAEHAAELLEAEGIICGLKTGVHHSTLRAFVKEQIESGVAIPEDAFGIYVGNRIKVK